MNLFMKKINVLIAYGDVKVFDKINNYEIYSDKITYKKNEELIFTQNNSRALSLNDNIKIYANDFEYNKILNKLLQKKMLF